jgi:RecA-family ATPase
MVVETNFSPKFVFERANDHVPSMKSNHVIRNLCQKSEVGIMVAPSNVGKTALAVALGAHVVQGKPVLSMPTYKGVVVHICGEGGNAVKDRISVSLDGTKGASDYLVIKKRINLGDAGEIMDFIRDLKEYLEEIGDRLSLVIIDTFIHSIGDLNENSSVDMSAAIAGAQEIAEAFDAHVLLVHHTGREEERGGRGSSAIRSNVDSEFTIKADSESNEAVLTTTKQRNLENGLRFSYALRKKLLGYDDEGYERSTVVAELLDGSERKGAKTQSQLNTKQIAVLSSMKAALACGEDQISTRALMPLVAYLEWSSSADEKAQQAGFRSVLNALEKRGMVVNEKRGKELLWSLPEVLLPRKVPS